MELLVQSARSYPQVPKYWMEEYIVESMSLAIINFNSKVATIPIDSHVGMFGHM